MKKLLLLSAACLMVVPAMAQRSGECAYTPLQNLVINARGPKEIQSLIERNVIFDEQVRCGGSLMQLAIRRGNPQVLAAIVRQDQKRVQAQVTLEAFPIPGAPKTIPLILFAAYYAPNKEIMELLVQAGANIGVVDDYGRNLLWYMDKNPVLKNTDLVDELNNRLLYSMGNQLDGESGTVAPAPEQMAVPAAAPQKTNKNAGLLDEQ